MKNVLRALLVVCLLSAAMFAAEPGRFFTYPTIHNDKIVFTYESDLWIVGAAGGVATRLTTFPGTESFAKLSPDGKWIAFTATYDGAQAVYLMPAEGGAPVRLTYNPGGAQVVAWTPDGTEVVFRSMFENVVGRDPNLYSVGIKGGAPVRLPLERGVLVSFIPEKHQFLYCRRGNEEYYWKRYKGGQYQDIWLYDAAAKTYTPVTDYVGKNSYPMWIGGQMYFVSDRTATASPTSTPRSSGPRTAVQVTKYADFDVMMPEHGRQVHRLRPGRLAARLRRALRQGHEDRRHRALGPLGPARPGHQPARLHPHGPPRATTARRSSSRPAATSTASRPAPGPTANLSWTPGHARDLPGPLAGRQDRRLLQRQDAASTSSTPSRPPAADWTQITTDLDRTVYRLAWSPDGRKILFGNKDYAIFWVDVAAKKLVKIDSSNQMKNDEFTWEIADYAWSPDSKWIAYSFVQANRNSQIFLYNIETGKKVAATTDFYDNLYPAFDADGDYLYYVSSRNFALRMDFYEDNHVIATPQQVMAVQLRDGEAPAVRRRRRETEARTRRPPPCPFRIDTEGLVKRTYPAARPARQLLLPQGRQGQGPLGSRSTPSPKTSTRTSSSPSPATTKWTLHIFDMAGRKDVAARRQGPGLRPVDERRAAPGAPRSRLLSRPPWTRPSPPRRRATSSTWAGSSTRSTSRRSGSRSSTTPGAGTAISSTTPASTAATGRPWATSTGPTSRTSRRGPS